MTHVSAAAIAYLIAGTAWTSQVLAERLLKDKDILRVNGGGVTFSGGEPLMQWDFVREVISRMPGMHTAIETSGFATDGVFQSMMDTVDLVLMDVKLMDADMHKHYTGVDNACILSHAQMLRDGDTPFIIRIPLIPGVNDTLSHFEGVAALVEGARQLVRVELLPYHQTAGAKYAMAGMAYTPEFDVEQSPRAMTEPFTSRGIEVLVL